MNKQKGMLIVFPSSRTKNLIKECYEKGIKPIVIHPNFNGKNNKNKEYEALVPMVALKQAMVSIKNNYSKYNYIEYTEQDDCRLIVDDVKKNYDILGVICCSDMAPKYTYELRDLLGMSNNPLELVNNGDNKYWVNNLINKKDSTIRTIKTIVVNKNYNIDEIIKQFTFPIFIKPISGGGSVNAYKICDKKELKEKLDFVFSQNIVKEMLVQEFAHGELYIVNFVSNNGNHYFTDSWKYLRVLTKNNGYIFENIELLTQTPLVQRMINYCVKCLDACGFIHGTTHIEVCVDENGIVLIEINWRVMGGNMFMNEKYIQNETITGLLIKNEIAPHKISKKLEKISAVKKQLITFCVVSHIDEEKTLVKYNILHIFKHLHSEVGLFALVQPGEKFAFGNNFDDTLCQIELSNKKVKKYIEEQKLIAEIMYYAFELIVEYKEKYKETLLGNKKFINLANTDTTDNVKNYFSNKKIFELGNYEEIKDIHKYNVVIINKNFFSADVCECFDQIEHLYKNIKKNTFVLISSNVMDSSIKGIHYLFALNKFNIETINENKISSNYYVYYKSK